MEFSRRTFIRVTGAGIVGLWVAGHTGVPVAVAQAPAAVLTAGAIGKFRQALLVPPVMPRAERLSTRGGRNVDYYEIAVRQFEQQVLPPGLPPTTVWGYGAVRADRRGRELVELFSAPSLTIEATAGTPVRVKWINGLVDDSGHYLPHLLPVDPTLHWANPGRLGSGETDSRPDLTGRTYVATESPSDPVDPNTEYTRYWGPVPMVTHVHGAVGVGDESDGYPEAWYLADAADLGDHAREGAWYEYFATKARRRFGERWKDGYAVMQYPNENRASTLWYHDHTLGMTRQNVYAGPAGFYLIRGGAAGDDSVTDRRSGRRAVLPGPAPQYGDSDVKRVYEIPLAIQDRSFTESGQLFYPDTRAFFDEYAGPYIPETDVPPLWNPEFFGNTLIVNGRTWPYLEVEQRRYRLRVLNGCQSRFLILDFGAIPGVSVWQIGNEGGLLPTPVDVTHLESGAHRVLLSPAERADLIVDFSGVPRGRHVLRNVGPDEPFGGGVPGEDFPMPDPEGTGQVLQFRVVRARERDKTTPPEFLKLPRMRPLEKAGSTRRLALLEHSHDEIGPTAAMLGVVDWAGSSGVARPLMWHDPVVINPAVGSTEVWEFYNLTEDAHPIHVHEEAFEVVDRQGIEVDGDRVRLVGEPSAPEPGERGVKDTVAALPEQVTRIKARFRNPGQFVWHCHILEHEDNEMMLPYRIGPMQPGQPSG